jgi:hypothetical protein
MPFPVGKVGTMAFADEYKRAHPDSDIALKAYFVAFRHFLRYCSAMEATNAEELFIIQQQFDVNSLQLRVQNRLVRHRLRMQEVQSNVRYRDCTKFLYGDRFGQVRCVLLHICIDQAVIVSGDDWSGGWRSHVTR